MNAVWLGRRRSPFLTPPSQSVFDNRFSKKLLKNTYLQYANRSGLKLSGVSPLGHRTDVSFSSRSSSPGKFAFVTLTYIPILFFSFSCAIQTPANPRHLFSKCKPWGSFVQSLCLQRLALFFHGTICIFSPHSHLGFSFSKPSRVAPHFSHVKSTNFGIPIPCTPLFPLRS
jgi:hypothetical protein